MSTITLTGSGSLFTRLGRIGRLIYLVNTHQGTLPAALESYYTEYDGLTPGTGLRDVVATAIANRDAFIANQGAWLPIVRDEAIQTVLRTVAAANPHSAGSLKSALQQVIADMVASSDTVERCAVAATPTAITGTVGNGVLITSLVRGDGLPSELVFEETGSIKCTGDSYTDGASSGSELFAYYGAVGDPTDTLNYNWPVGSGIATGFTVASPGNSTTLVNAGFETFTTANIPDNWTIHTGTAGTNVFQETGTVYPDGTESALKLVSTVANVRLEQQFGSAAGTSTSPTPLVPYGVNLWYRVTANPAGSTLSVSLVDGSGTVVNDTQGTANTISVSLPGVSTGTWLALSGVFRLPKSLPAVLKFRITLADPTVGSLSCFVDRLTMAPMTQVYPSGPWVSVHGGSTPFADGDGWDLAVTNDRAGATYNATFQALFDRLFGMRDLGLVLPSSNSPTIADTLITAP